MKVKSFTPKAGVLVLLCLMGSTAFAQNTKTVEYGFTTVKLSSTFTGALGSLGVSPGVVWPTRLSESGTASFPITGGAIDLDTASGNVLHSGGLTLTAGGIETRLQSFIIDTTTSGAPVITGLVIAGNQLVGRVPLFNLTLPADFSLPISAKRGFELSLKGVGVTLTSQAAAALNGVYSVTAFTEGLNIGTADVSAVLSIRKQ
jgi:hypothetical protein